MRRLLLILLLLVAAPAHALRFPAFAGYVVDEAAVLPPATEAELTRKLEAFQQATKRQLVIATVPSLQGASIEDFGYQLGRAWGVGRAELDDGVILLVAPNERKVRIEVGYGLTPYLTDALSSLIIRRQIVPAFKAGDLPGGVVAGADAIIAQLQLPEAEARQQVAAAEQPPAEEEGVSGLAIAFMVIWALLFFGGMLPRRWRRNIPIIVWSDTGAGGDSSWGGGGGGSSFGGGGGGSFGGGGASGSW